jgi:hypothetical protein
MSGPWTCYGCFERETGTLVRRRRPAGEAWYRPRKCGHDEAVCIPQLSKRKSEERVPVVMAPILTLSTVECYRIQPSASAKPHLFPFSLPTRAIDKEGRSTLRYARAPSFCTAQSLGSVSSSYLHPAFRAFFLPVSLKSGLFLVRLSFKVLFRIPWAPVTTRSSIQPAPSLPGAPSQLPSEPPLLHHPLRHLPNRSRSNPASISSKSPA